MPYGCWKISDGLFLGNEECAADLDFMEENKVTRVINCSGKQVSNSYEMLGVVYMTFNWEDTDEQTVFEKGKGDAIVEKVLRFINDAHNRAEGTLVHSVHGQSRSYCLLAAYLMRSIPGIFYSAPPTRNMHRSFDLPDMRNRGETLVFLRNPNVSPSSRMFSVSATPGLQTKENPQMLVEECHEELLHVTRTISTHVFVKCLGEFMSTNLALGTSSIDRSKPDTRHHPTQDSIFHRTRTYRCMQNKQPPENKSSTKKLRLPDKPNKVSAPTESAYRIPLSQHASCLTRGLGDRA